MFSTKEKEKLAREIYWIFREHNGSITSVSGFLGRNDSTELSRQLNPDDRRRHNFYIQTLEVSRALAKFAPELEEKLWQVLERERSKYRKDAPCRKVQRAELMAKVISELGDSVFAENTNASQDELEKEGFELMTAAKNYYEKVKENRTASGD